MEPPPETWVASAERLGTGRRMPVTPGVRRIAIRAVDEYGQEHEGEQVDRDRAVNGGKGAVVRQQHW